MKMEALKNVCLRFLDGDLTDQEADAFDRLIAESEEAARVLARLAIQDSCFESATALAFLRGLEQDRTDLAIGAGLQAGYQAPVGWSLQDHPDGAVPEKVQPPQSSIKDAMALLGYVLRESAKTKPAKWLASSAAIILVALIIWQIWGFTSSPQDQGQGPLTQDSEPVDLQGMIVATLTAEHDAVWDRRPGQDLYTGQRFTLTDGFAEITTSQGAVAMIEAPAKVELLDKNVLYLHTGKLVGTCETASSKGFIVRTPELDITDLGTRFGVVYFADRSTEVHVLEGEVAVRHIDQVDGPSLTLRQGQAAQASIETPSTRPIELRADRFIWAQDGADLTLSLDDRIEKLSGDSIPLSTAELISESKIFVIAEQAGVTLTDALPVVANRPGSYYGRAFNASEQLAAGTQVDSFLFHMNAGQPGVASQNTARYTFDHPILGVIIDSDQLRQTDAILGLRHVTYDTKPRANARGLEEHYDRDRIHIEPDGKTIVVELNQATSPDQFRVLLRADNAPASEQPGS